MDNKEVIQIGSKVYLFPRLPNEIDEVYYGRMRFLKKHAPKTEKKYIQVLKLSMIWANAKYLGCSYPSSLMKEIED